MAYTICNAIDTVLNELIWQMQLESSQCGEFKYIPHKLISFEWILKISIDFESTKLYLSLILNSYFQTMCVCVLFHSVLCHSKMCAKKELNHLMNRPTPMNTFINCSCGTIPNFFFWHRHLSHIVLLFFLKRIWLELLCSYQMELYFFIYSIQTIDWIGKSFARFAIFVYICFMLFVFSS